MYKLLIADDEKIIRESVSELIDWEALDISITACCKNGLEALDAIMDTAPDIVMTDIRMPGIDGLELINKIRSLDPRIQFIILTGHPEFEYARRALKYGVREYLLKPISEEAIIDAVKNATAALPEYASPAIGMLMAGLLEARDSMDQEQSRRLLTQFLAHSVRPEELRHVGIALFMELHTRFGPLSSEDMSKFTGQLLSEPRVDRLRSIIIDQMIFLLFDEAEESAFPGPGRNGKGKDTIADTVKSYVSSHLGDENLSLKYIAENMLYINVNYLSRAFTKQAGEKFSNYLNRSRIEKAKMMLRQNAEENIHAIAEAVGFGGNPQYFSQVFKKYTGMTPSQFIDELGETG